MDRQEYYKYLLSERWKAKRSYRIRIDDYKCFCCGIGVIGSSAHVHHLHYKNAGKEKEEDLITMCKRCHSQIHTRESYDMDSALEMKTEIQDDKFRREKELKNRNTDSMYKLSDILNSK